VSIVWVGIEGDEIVSAHLGTHQKVKNVRREERVALSIATDRRNSSGMTEYPVVYGCARITAGGARDAPTAGREVHRSGCEIPADGQSAGRFHHPHHARLFRRGRPLDITLS
jgi:hypothetical protein